MILTLYAFIYSSYQTLIFGLELVGRRPQFRQLGKYIHKTVRTDTDRARCDWLLLMIKY